MHYKPGIDGWFAITFFYGTQTEVCFQAKESAHGLEHDAYLLSTKL